MKLVLSHETALAFEVSLLQIDWRTVLLETEAQPMQVRLHVLRYPVLRFPDPAHACNPFIWEFEDGESPHDASEYPTPSQILRAACSK